MNNFSLSVSKDKMAPICLESRDGEFYPINADFRNILKIFRLLSDPEVINAHKNTLIMRWFFPSGVPCDGFELLNDFIGSKGEESSETKRQFCFEFDAEEIYASFLLCYNMDLIDIEFLHWYRFEALLHGLFFCGNPLSKKIDIRNLDIRKCADKTAARKAKTAVQIPEIISRTDESIDRKIAERLKEGKPIDDLIGGGSD